mgnify:CR=1 FL=1
MIPKWKRMKGVKFRCDKCHAEYISDEFDFEEGVCLYCMFPETMKHKPTEFSYEKGDPINKVRDSLDYLDQTVEKQGKKATENLRKYKERNYTKTKYNNGKVYKG